MSFIVEFKFGIGDTVKMLPCGGEGEIVTATTYGAAVMPKYLVRGVVGAEECRSFSEKELAFVKSWRKGRPS